MWKLGLAAWGASSLFGLIGQAAGPAASGDLPTFLTNLGVSVPVAGVLMWRLWLADRAVDRKEAQHQAELDRLNRERDEQHEKYVAMVERMAPLLAEAIRTLPEAQRGMRATMSEARIGGEVLDRLESLLDDIQRDRGAPRERDR